MGGSATYNGDFKLSPQQTISILKSKGNYINGNKSGEWVTYYSPVVSRPFTWELQHTIQYSFGVKNGYEIFYQKANSSKTPIILIFWIDGVEDTIKTFNINSPFNVERIYKRFNDKNRLIETYYANKTLKTKIIDTIINNNYIVKEISFNPTGARIQIGFYNLNGEPHGEWKSYYDIGTLQSTQIYENGLLNGAYNYYYSNGQLWTKRLYKNDKLWSVLKTFDKNGIEKDVGTLKRGNGYINVYNEKGELVSKVFYKDGIKQ